MKTATELLGGILNTLIKIEGQLGGGSKTSGSSNPMNISANLSSFSKVNDKTKTSFVTFMKDLADISTKGKNLDKFSDGLVKMSSTLPNLVKNLGELSKLKSDTTNKSLGSLKTLFDFMYKLGDISTKGENLDKFFDSLVKMSSTLPNLVKNLGELSKLKSDTTNKSLGSLKTLFDFMYKLGDISTKGENLDKFFDSLVKMSSTLPNLVKNLGELSKLKSDTTNKSLGSLKTLFDFMYKLGGEEESKRVTKAATMFDKIGTALDKIAAPLKKIQSTLLYLGLSFVAFGASLLLSAMMLKVSGPGSVITFIGMSLVTMVTMFGMVALAEKYVSSGTKVIKDMGIGMAALSLGIVSFALTIRLLPIILGQPSLTTALAVGEMLLIVGGIVGMFWLIGKADKQVGKGNEVVKGMGLGMATLSLGIIAFALTLRLLPLILGDESNGSLLKGTIVMATSVAVMVGMFALIGFAEPLIKKGNEVVVKMGLGMAVLSLGIITFALTMRYLPNIIGKESEGTIAGSMLTMGLIVGGIVGTFVLMGLAENQIKKGFAVVGLLSLGLVILSVSVIALATAAKYLQGGALSLGQQNLNEKDENKKMVMSGLGTIGLIFLASAAAFSILGIPAVAGLVALGAVTAIAMSISLIIFATSVSKLATVAKQVDNKLSSNITMMVGGTLEGLLNGFSVLSGGKTGISGTVEFIKNSAKLFAGIGILMSVSLTLSMFAYALSAFAELSNMKVINGYDKNGKPIFGEKINIKNVADNVSYSISTFITSLLTSTEDLTTSKAKALKKMGRSLTGRRGILSAVNDFADILKTFAQFGQNGEIGYVDMIPNGTDQDGNAIFKQVPSKVKITTVASNIANSFGTFVDELVKHSSIFEITGEKGSSMMKLAETLMGSGALKVFGLSFGKEKPGLLAPISKFSEILNMYAKFGDTNELPLLDKDGKPTGKGISTSKIATNIVNALSGFSKTLGDAKISTDTDKAEKNISKFSALMETTDKITKSVDNLSKLSISIKDLAEGIGLLAVNVDKLNTDKLNKIMDKSASSTVYSNTKSSVGSSNASNEPDWEAIAQQIGDQVGAKVAAALKGGQFTFEFSSAKSNEGVFSLTPR